MSAISEEACYKVSHVYFALEDQLVYYLEVLGRGVGSWNIVFHTHVLSVNWGVWSLSVNWGFGGFGRMRSQ